MILKLVLLLLAGYFLIRFMLRFVLPVVRIVTATQRQVQNLNNQMNQTKEPEKKGHRIDGDYIDFEEVK